MACKLIWEEYVPGLAQLREVQVAQRERNWLCLYRRSRQKFLLHPQQHPPGNGWKSLECAPYFVSLYKAQANMFSHSVTTSPGLRTGWTWMPSGLALGKLPPTCPPFSGGKEGKRSLGGTGTEGGDPEEVRHRLLVLQDLTS